MLPPPASAAVGWPAAAANTLRTALPRRPMQPTPVPQPTYLCHQAVPVPAYATHLASQFLAAKHNLDRPVLSKATRASRHVQDVRTCAGYPGPSAFVRPSNSTRTSPGPPGIRCPRTPDPQCPCPLSTATTRAADHKMALALLAEETDDEARAPQRNGYFDQLLPGRREPHRGRGPAARAGPGSRGRDTPFSSDPTRRCPGAGTRGRPRPDDPYCPLCSQDATGDRRPTACPHGRWDDAGYATQPRPPPQSPSRPPRRLLGTGRTRLPTQHS